MAVDEGLVAWVTEALEPVGSVTMRRMMGGATLYMDGTIFGIVHDASSGSRPTRRAMRSGTRPGIASVLPSLSRPG
jgi:hypothetical protein